MPQKFKRDCSNYTTKDITPGLMYALFHLAMDIEHITRKGSIAKWLIQSILQ